ncbi:hypothetical protein [Microbacterium sp. nov. GSS16]|uniref:hypothetical protein n=1 Tax=Microbacterium sp. nov. GSS16 TaxID=3019890 RepID=UPI0023052D28|nr:hypothetical protein [Microbacterium sp. nov. GSS16]MEE2815759.1 hypothetical protein [Actinomycetota bacterium]WCD92039.1 hypothetical protein PGB26_10170 [Microbacterium sp. nov. GSS16]
MSNIHEQPDEEPSTEELDEPSTEKEPGEEPKVEHPEDPEPDHDAVGIGVIGGPQSDTADQGSAPASDGDQAG